MASLTAKETGGDWAQRTYEAMAPVYDDFTAHHEYDAWVADLLKLLERRGLAGKRLLDVACGTGKSFLPMLPRGWQVTACDISPAMLERAREKVGDAVRARRRRHARSCPNSASSTWSGRSTTRSTTCSAQPNWNAPWRGCAPTSPRPGCCSSTSTRFRLTAPSSPKPTVVERGGRRLIWRGQAAPPTWHRARSANRAWKSCRRRGTRTAMGRAVRPAAVAHPPPASLPRSRGAGRPAGVPAWSAWTSTVTASTASHASRWTNRPIPRRSTSPESP